MPPIEQLYESRKVEFEICLKQLIEKYFVLGNYATYPEGGCPSDCGELADTDMGEILRRAADAMEVEEPNVGAVDYLYHRQPLLLNIEHYR